MNGQRGTKGGTQPSPAAITVDLRPRGRTGYRGDDTAPHAAKAAHGARSSPRSSRPDDRPRRISRHGGCRLKAGLRARGRAQGAIYCPPLPGCDPSASGEVRFHIPLRGSAGFAPASLLIPSLDTDKEMKAFGGRKSGRMDVRSQTVAGGGACRWLSLGGWEAVAAEAAPTGAAMLLGFMWERLQSRRSGSKAGAAIRPPGVRLRPAR